MATHSNPRFMREKVRAGVAYMKSKAFRERFGLRFARWLVITTGERRLANLLTATEKAGGSGQFYFTTFTQAEGANVLADEIWQLAGNRELTRIIPNDRLKAKSRQYVRGEWSSQS